MTTCLWGQWKCIMIWVVPTLKFLKISEKMLFRVNHFTWHIQHVGQPVSSSAAWESAAVFSSNAGTIQGQPACPLISDLEHCANTLSCQCHGRMAEGPLFPWASPFAKADKWFLFVLCSKGRSYRYNPQMMSGICQWSLWMTKTSPTPSKKKNTFSSSQEDWEPKHIIDFFFPYLLLNRGSGYKSRSKGFCVLKCG